MTRNDSLSDSIPLADAVDRAVATYGAIPVLIRAVVATVRFEKPPPRTRSDSLSDHLRRDVGLPPNTYDRVGAPWPR